jgi:glyoxylase-like metal-dependent hydrolase (beta-lactamase superfamily II)
MLRESGAELRAIWITHGHLDHIGAVEAIRRVYPVPVYLHAADRPVYDAQSVFAEAYGVPFEQPAAADAEIAHGDVMRVGTLSFDVHHTPGHSPGHVVFLGHGVMLGGDVLFAGSIGRVDLPGGSMADMNRSLREVILPLDDDTAVHPGHGPSTTIARERATNPFLLELAP